MLIEEEVKHFNIIQKMKSNIPQQVRETDILNNAKNVFAKMKESGDKVKVDANQIELYKKAQGVEQNSRTFYLEKAKDAVTRRKRYLPEIGRRRKEALFFIRKYHSACFPAGPMA